MKMIRSRYGLIACILLLAGFVLGDAPQVLKALKDNFGRSNRVNTNNGANEFLAIAHTPDVMRSFIAFDLSSVSNEILTATLRLYPHQDNEHPVSLVVAPMVSTEGNDAWEEGRGGHGILGHPAQEGESSYALRAVRSSPWEDASGNPVQHLSASGLWSKPLAKLSQVSWKHGEWVEIPLNSVHQLEELRTGERKQITLGVWGTSGNGFYLISSCQSDHDPELVLTVKQEQVLTVK